MDTVYLGNFLAFVAGASGLAVAMLNRSAVLGYIVGVLVGWWLL